MGMYGGGAAPEAPDPKATAAAQTGTNVATAVANANLGNVNQVTPNGNLTYSESGTKKFTDPTTGKTFDIPTYTATTTLSDAQGRIAHYNNMASENLGRTAAEQSSFLSNYLGKGVDTSNIPAAQYGVKGKDPGIATSIAPTKGGIQYDFADAGKIQNQFDDAGAITKTYGTDFEAGRRHVEDAMFSRLNPQIDRARAAEETRLQEQGVRLGSTAWQNAMDDFNRGVNDQRTGIVLAGGQEQSRLTGLEADRAAFQNAAQQQNYGQLLGRAGFANAAQDQNFNQLFTRANFNNSAQQQEFGQNAQQAAFGNAAQQQWYGQAANNVGMNNNARSQALSEAYAARNQPINEISALMSGAAVQNPNFVSTNMPQIPTVDYAGLVQSNYANRMQAYQQQQQNQQSMMGGLMGLGASAIMMSDRRLKMDVEHVGTGVLGLPLYAFRYVWGGPRRVGVMAQDVLRVLPAAVVRMASGFLAVDYGRLAREETA